MFLPHTNEFCFQKESEVDREQGTTTLTYLVAGNSDPSVWIFSRSFLS